MPVLWRFPCCCLLLQACPAYTYLTVTGGSIGNGPPMALGAAIACPSSTVINLQADGSGMYTLQVCFGRGDEGGRGYPSLSCLVCQLQSVTVALPLPAERCPVETPTHPEPATDTHLSQHAVLTPPCCHQALWTQARERTNVITIICDNGSYQILKVGGRGACGH
jgi:hypothetical protein